MLKKILSGFYTKEDQIIRDCEMKTVKANLQILILWFYVKNELDSNEYQKENPGNQIQGLSGYRSTVFAAVLADDNWLA